MKKLDSFTEFVNKQKAEKEKPFRDALLFGKSEADTPRARDFVRSCQEFFERKGYLTPKQVSALYGHSPSTYRDDDDGHGYEVEDLDDSDFAGGDL